MRSIRFFALLASVSLLAACGDGKNPGLPALSLPALSELSAEAQERAIGTSVSILQTSLFAELPVSPALPSTHDRVLHAVSMGPAAAHLLLVAGPESVLLYVSGLDTTTPRIVHRQRLPYAIDLQRSEDTVYVLTHSTLHSLSRLNDIDMSISLPSTAARAFAVKDSYAYVAAGVDGLFVVDLSRNDPAPVSTATLAIFPQHVAIAGDFAYVAQGFLGVRLFDISEGDMPIDLGSVAVSGCPLNTGVQKTQVLVQGEKHHVYLEQPAGTLRTLVINAEQQAQENILTASFGMQRNVDCKTLALPLQQLQLVQKNEQAWLGGRCCDGDGSGLQALARIDEDPLSPRMIGLQPAGLWAVAGEYLYELRSSLLRVHRYAEESTRRTALSGVVAVGGFDLHLQGDYSYIAHPGGLVQVQVAARESTGTAPLRRSAEFLATRGRLGALATARENGATLLYVGLQNQPEIELWEAGPMARTVIATGRTFIAAADSTEVQSIGVSALLAAGGSFFAADSTGQLYAVPDTGANAVRELALAATCALSELSKVACILLDSPVHTLAFSSPHLYAGTRAGQLYALRWDATAPTPTLRIERELSLFTAEPGQDGVRALQIIESSRHRIVYAAVSTAIHVLDFSRDNPRLQSIPVMPAALDLVLQGQRLYVAAGDRVLVYDVQQPEQPQELSALQIYGFAFFLAADAAGLHILDRYGWRDYYRILTPLP